jgi:hypothetical protein
MNHQIFSALTWVRLAGLSVLPAAALARQAGRGMAPVSRAYHHNADADLRLYGAFDNDGAGGTSLDEWTSTLGKGLERRAGIPGEAQCRLAVADAI